MPEDRPTRESIPLTQWFETLGGILGPSGGPGLSEEEQAALLDIARIAAHDSERIAAPLTTFLAGVAYAGLSTTERAAALRALAERLDSE